MNDVLFEQLLSEEEGSALDFKGEQYRFAGASDEEKAELLKDTLGFANAWRRSDAYILIGVEDVRAGRGNVVGIAPGDQLDDHSLQQFVNSKTNRPIRFRYEAFGFEGKQVGIIHIEEQDRPVYLTRDFGKLKRHEVYVRRGSSTDPQKPATPDEIARMGLRSGPELAELTVEFANLDGDTSLGTEISWDAEYCEMPPAGSIPDLKADRRSTSQPPYGIDPALFSPYDRINPDYYRQRAEYEFARRVFRPVRLAVRNVGKAVANSVRTELVVVASDILVFHPSELPGVPRRRTGIDYSARFQPALPRAPGDVTIDRNDERARVEIEYGNLQPGRRVRSDVFSLGIMETGGLALKGQIFADNLPQPKDFTLTISANVAQTAMTVAELTALPEPAQPDA